MEEVGFGRNSVAKQTRDTMLVPQFGAVVVGMG